MTAGGAVRASGWSGIEYSKSRIGESQQAQKKHFSASYPLNKHVIGKQITVDADLKAAEMIEVSAYK